MVLSPLLSPPSLCCHVQEELAQTEERLQSKRSQLEDLVVQVCAVSVCLSVSQSPCLSVVCTCGTVPTTFLFNALFESVVLLL